MTNECIFCKIAAGEIPARFAYRNDESRVMAIEDLNPQAPTHLLVIPLAHYPTLADAIAEPGFAPTVRALFDVASQLGTERGAGSGFRIVVNTGADGGQTVNHLHLHVLAGRRLTWPPG